jgi:hypothetical protein
VKHTVEGVGEAVEVEGVGEAVEVDGVLRSRRRRHAPGEAIEVEGKAVETTACSRGDVVEGALCR